MTSSVYAPVSVTELSSMVRDANDQGRSFQVRGGGTALDIGNASDEGDPLDISGISGVIDYRPADLTISVRAGTRMAEIRDTLGEHGQELPVDVPFPAETTIGGLMACGFAGPRRLGSGTLKDLILGCEYVRGDGLVAKAGGQVVKNVSGFEIPRLLHGSWGALAVLTSINFKVTPIPKAERTLIWSIPETRDAFAIARDIRQGHPSVTAIEIERANGKQSLVVRLMGRSGALDLQVRDLVDTLGQTDAIPDAKSSAWWQDRNDRFASAGGDVQLVVRTRPRYCGEVVTEVGKRLGVAARSAISPGIGVARMQFDADAIDAANFWQQLDLSSLPGGTEAIVEFAPEEWKRGIDTWGPHVPGWELMQAVKTQFDPKGVYNPGRLFI